MGAPSSPLKKHAISAKIIGLFGSLIENMGYKFGNYPLCRYLCIRFSPSI